MSEALHPLPWQQDLWLELTASALSGRLHHALLFTGPAGIGKRHFARAFAAFLLCEKRSGFACGQCRSCTQLSAGTHPNASLIGLDGNLGLCLGERGESALAHWEPKPESKRMEIAIDAVRSFSAQTALTSHHGQSRIALVDPAERMSLSSVNGFLKTVEEPAAGTHLVFITEQPALLRPTLRSRCQRIRFAPPDRAQAEDWLQAKGQALGASGKAYRAPLLALERARSGAAERETQWQDWMQRLSERKTDPLAVAADVGKDDAAGFLRWLAGSLLEQLRTAPGQRGRLLARFAETVGESQRRLDRNAKPELVLEALLIQWWSLHRPARG